MALRAHSPSVGRRGPPSRAGLRLGRLPRQSRCAHAHRVPQAKPSVHRYLLFAAHGAHPAAGDRCGRRVVGAGSRAPAELAATPGARAGEADRVVFGQPGRRRRRTLAGARLCQSPGGAAQRGRGPAPGGAGIAGGSGDAPSAGTADAAPIFGTGGSDQRDASSRQRLAGSNACCGRAGRPRVGVVAGGELGGGRTRVVGQRFADGRAWPGA